MKDYLNSPIKEVITAFPEVGKILEEYHIACVPCTVGSCLWRPVGMSSLTLSRRERSRDLKDGSRAAVKLRKTRKSLIHA